MVTPVQVCHVGGPAAQVHGSGDVGSDRRGSVSHGDAPSQLPPEEGLQNQPCNRVSVTFLSTIVSFSDFDQYHLFFRLLLPLFYILVQITVLHSTKAVISCYDHDVYNCIAVLFSYDENGIAFGTASH